MGWWSGQSKMGIRERDGRERMIRKEGRESGEIGGHSTHEQRELQRGKRRQGHTSPRNRASAAMSEPSTLLMRAFLLSLLPLLILSPNR